MEPAQTPQTGGEADIRPSVGTTSRQLPIWVFVAGAIVAATILFLILDSRRRALNAPAVKAERVDLSGAAPPTLYIPPAYVPEPGPAFVAATPTPVATPAPPPPPPPAPLPEPQVVYVAPSVPQGTPPAQPARRDASQILVIDNGSEVRGEPAQAGPPGGVRDGARSAAAAGPAMDTSRARAGAFANRGTTIMQGTLIPAVLESALDSTRSGFARAIVSRDVRGFDGTRVLIPRGSRLIGEYGSEVAPGQKRALVTWTRLIRPDGATIAIGSPVADTLGRTGVRAQVNSHFFERFSGAILQSVLDIGVNLASREVGGSTVIALPGSLGGIAQPVRPQQITPTLTVKRGTSISVFVARDLDFTGVESGR